MINETTNPRCQKRRRMIIWVSAITAVIVLAVGGALFALSAKQHEVFPKLVGSPTVGTWYGVYPDGAMSALGEPYHGIFRRGTSNNVMVLFNGGGVSINAEMAANPNQKYFNVATGGDALARFGLGADNANNPLLDWTVIILPYTTGDFHAGTGDFTFKGTNGATQTIHHVGYRNFDLVMNNVLPHVGRPDKLLIAGYSAGGFGTALLAEHVMSYFPNTSNVTVVVDSSLLLHKDWHGIATNVWHTPKEIADRITTDNLTLDMLSALAHDHPDVKVLFSSSTRDDALVEVQAYFDTGAMTKSAAGGEAYQRQLSTFVAQLRNAVPHVAFYLFQGASKEKGLTQHTMLLFNSFSTDLGQITPAQWIKNATNGKLEDYGLDLLR